jgi:hypothetical protein
MFLQSILKPQNNYPPLIIKIALHSSSWQVKFKAYSSCAVRTAYAQSTLAAQ